MVKHSHHLRPPDQAQKEHCVDIDLKNNSTHRKVPVKQDGYLVSKLFQEDEINHFKVGKTGGQSQETNNHQQQQENQSCAPNKAL